jgi:hypothetical protein
MVLSNEENISSLLPYNFNVVIFFKELIHYQDKSIYEKTFFPHNFSFFEILKKIEIERINYLLKNYHKIRIWKIEKNFGYNHNEKKIFNFLSQFEKNYARAYFFFFFKIIKGFFLSLNIIKLKKKLKLEKKIFFKNTINVLNFFVFFRVINKKLFQKKNNFLFQSSSYFYESEIYCMKFNTVKRLIFAGTIFLL